MQKLIPYALLIFFAALLGVSLALLLPAYHDMKRMEVRIFELEKKMAQRKAERIELLRLIYSLRHDPKAIEKVAREKFNYAESDEIIFTYDQDELEKAMKEEAETP